MSYMRKVRDVFDEWAESGKDLGMETGHADAVEEMLEFSLKERSEIGEQFSFLDPVSYTHLTLPTILRV